MRQQCVVCHRPTIRAREVDGNIIRIEDKPSEDGELAVWGDLNDDPTAFWNLDPASPDNEFWDVPPDLPRFRLHRCEGAS